MPNVLRWMVVTDQDYYPDVEIFDDFQKARLRFGELAEQHMGDFGKKVYLGVLLRTHDTGYPLVQFEDW